jgi:hypothetical protein
MMKLVEEAYLMYPDVSHIFVAKAQRRRKLATLSWEEKVAIIERMRSVTKDMWKESDMEPIAYPVWTPYDAHIGTATLRDALEEDDTTYSSSITTDASS